jgi:hypothetical protein
MLQARGRLIDFLMDDINAYSDAQVGAAARVVHAGCKAALLEHVRISPVRTEGEGATVQVAAGYSPAAPERSPRALGGFNFCCLSHLGGLRLCGTASLLGSFRF